MAAICAIPTPHDRDYALDNVRHGGRDHGAYADAEREIGRRYLRVAYPRSSA
jgi:hypothetical protein